MKKNSILLTLLGVFLLGTTTSLTAVNCGNSCNNCYEWSFCNGKVVVGADWLYWKVQQDSLNFGVVERVQGGVAAADAAATEPTAAAVPGIKRNYHSLKPDFKYDSGYRVHLGYELPCDCWDIDVSYTYMPSHSSIRSFATNTPDSERIKFNKTLYPILRTQESTSSLDAVHKNVSAKWTTTLNCIDLDLGRTVCFGECLKIRPHIGARFGWFDEKLHVRYNEAYENNGEVAADAAVQRADTNVHSHFALKEKFTGYGVEGGLWGEWQVGCGVSVVGHVGGSILYSKFRIHQSAISKTINNSQGSISDGLTATAHYADTIHTGTPTLDYFLGLQYADCICDMLFSAHVGWEQHVIFDANRLSTVRGNLVTQGLTLGASLGF
jgi:hypothetical protein